MQRHRTAIRTAAYVVQDSRSIVADLAAFIRYGVESARLRASS